jgi:adenylate kinase
MKKLKLTHNFSSLMLEIEKKWQKVKENSQIKDVKKLFN